MKIIYVILIALILSVLAFFLAIRITDSTGAALFLLGMLPVTFFIIFTYTKLLDIFHVRKFVYVALYTFIACYVMVFATTLRLGSDGKWGVEYALLDSLHVMMDVYLLICNIAITLIYSTLFVLFSRLSRKKE
ncbi:hypothetical protein [uncultured Capnocytophaga sp.]|uniref:hypothetical protein n=1 Tax=uncultured Capnocytophaga sp. TaxID=159273 RepID=UPI00263209F0|nr:hypothetical protein [uncultured Capnocytophaga sp.]